MKKAAFLLVMALLSVMLGCDILSSDRNAVHIWISPWDSFTDKEFDQYIVQPVAKKYPDIHIKKLVKPITERNLNQFKSEGIIPDVIFTTASLLKDLKPFGLLHNTENLLQASEFNVSRIEPIALESVKIAGGQSYLTGVPITRQFSALYYNKDIFDKFKVSYPNDGMTWQNVAELAARVTNKEGGTQYRGMEPDIISRAASALRASYVDMQTKQSIVNNDTWKRIFETIKPIYDIPGNEEMVEVKNAYLQFFDERRLAMLGGPNWLQDIAQLDDSFHWDLVSYPVFEEAVGTGMQFDAQVMVIAEPSKHKDEAVKIINTLLSDEVQMDLSRNGRVPVLAKEEAKLAFGTSMRMLQGKNIQAVFKTTPAKPIAPGPFNGAAGVIMGRAMEDVVFAGKDIDQALQEASDNINLHMYLE